MERKEVFVILFGRSPREAFRLNSREALSNSSFLLRNNSILIPEIIFLNELGDWELGTIISLDLFPAENHFQRITSQRKSQAGGAIPKHVEDSKTRKSR